MLVKKFPVRAKRSGSDQIRNSSTVEEQTITLAGNKFFVFSITGAKPILIKYFMCRGIEN
jgi:hypothetical protein